MFNSTAPVSHLIGNFQTLTPVRGGGLILRLLRSAHKDHALSPNTPHTAYMTYTYSIYEQPTQHRCMTHLNSLCRPGIWSEQQRKYIFKLSLLYLTVNYKNNLNFYLNGSNILLLTLILQSNENAEVITSMVISLKNCFILLRKQCVVKN